MASYKIIDGYIEDIYRGESQQGTPYLGILFFSKDANNYPEIKMWMTERSLKIDLDKLKELFRIAGIANEFVPVDNITSAIEKLSRPEFAALKIPILADEEFWEGKTREKYSLAWGKQEVSDSAFASFKDETAKKLAAIKAAAESADPKPAPYDGDIPF